MLSEYMYHKAIKAYFKFKSYALIKRSCKQRNQAAAAWNQQGEPAKSFKEDSFEQLMKLASDNSNNSLMALFIQYAKSYIGSILPQAVSSCWE